MGERTSHAPGTFSWADLSTPDATAAKSFYGELFGWEAEDMPGAAGAGLVNAPGALCWNDLGTTEVDAAMAFYAELLGWSYEQRMAEDPLRYMRIHNGDSENGSIHLQGDEERGEPPNWVVYFATADVDPANSTVAELGGQVVVEPVEVPAGGRVSVVTDPEGAAFGLFDGPLDP